MRTEVEYVNPFVEAAVKVIQQVTGVTFRRGRLAFRRNVAPSYDVSIVIGVFGYVSGQVVYSMGTTVAARLVGKMLQGAPADKVKGLFNDTLGELANMITGTATSMINDRMDLALKVTTPAIITGSGISVSFVTKPTISLGLYSQSGPIEINIALDTSTKPV